jgi:hypothetical protein
VSDVTVRGGAARAGNAEEIAANAPAPGYLHADYAAALAEHGRPLALPRAGGWLLERRVPGADASDAMWCYPLLCCRDWTQLDADLSALAGELISVAVVTDPFGAYDETLLRACFPDVVSPFKQHFVVDLADAPETFVHPHHRRSARKARAVLSVERCAEPTDALDDWTTLYETLVERHGISGIAAFSRASFARQLAVPGLVALRAREGETTVGMLLWYVQADVAYYHLGAYSARGYELRASFALFSYALEYFAAQGLRYLNLGGGAGTNTNGASGLTRFKAGWANQTRTAYFCGRVFDRALYDELVRARGVAPTHYFPAYRLGEFQ